MSNVATADDAALVAGVLNGDNDAFGKLVARYQSAVCGLAYSACGNISQSEDLAQEAFIIAWRKIGELEEPAKFKAWLYGIARNVVNNTSRRQTRNPLAVSEPLDEGLNFASAASNPTEHAISKEEEAILWRSLDQIPEAYREPLVLFYREHQSIERVAAVLGISEEAARQRLSRGRKLLQERVIAFVEGALERTGPGPAFTLGVLAALPGTALTTKAALVGAAAKGGAIAKASGLLGLFGAVLNPALALLGMLVDYRTRKRAGLSESMLKPLKAYYLAVTASIAVVVLATYILVVRGSALVKTSPALFVVLILSLFMGYPLLIWALARQLHRAFKKAAGERSSVGISGQGMGSGWEYRSRMTWLGLPLVHVRFGARTGEWKWGFAKAWIAISDGCSLGAFFAYGGVAIAPFSLGACAVGLLAYGAIAAGVAVWGGFAFAVWAFGVFAFGWQAFASGCAIAWNLAWGSQYAIAHDYALSAGTVSAAQANTPLSEHLFKTCWGHHLALGLTPYFYWLMWLWATPMMVLTISKWIRAGLRQKPASATNH